MVTRNNIVKLVEWERRPSEPSEPIRFTDKDLQAIQKFPLSLYPQGEGLFYLGAKEHVGVIRLPSGLTVFIEPKIPAANVLYMYLKSKRVSLRYEWETVRQQEDFGLLDLVIHLLTEKAEDLLGHGLRRGYVATEENLKAPRGRVEFLKDVRYNLGLRHRVYCRRYLHTPDILENRILLASVYYGKFIPLRAIDDSKARIHYRIRRLLTALGAVSLTAVSPEDCDRVVFSRCNENYRDVIPICRLVLEGCTPFAQPGTGDSYAWLLNMNTLFEDYVASVLEQHLGGMKRQEWGFLAMGRRIKVRPDLVYTTSGNVIVLDTKYKRLTREDECYEGRRLYNYDHYQILSYCHAFRTGVGILIYPLDRPAVKSRKKFVVRTPLQEEGAVEINELEVGLCGSWSDLHHEEDRLKEGIVSIANEKYSRV